MSSSNNVNQVQNALRMQQAASGSMPMGNLAGSSVTQGLQSQIAGLRSMLGGGSSSGSMSAETMDYQARVMTSNIQMGIKEYQLEQTVNSATTISGIDDGLEDPETVNHKSTGDAKKDADEYNKTLDEAIDASGGKDEIESVKTKKDKDGNEYKEITMSNGDVIRTDKKRTGISVDYADSGKKDVSHKFTASKSSTDDQERIKLIDEHEDDLLADFENNS